MEEHRVIRETITRDIWRHQYQISVTDKNIKEVHKIVIRYLITLKISRERVYHIVHKYMSMCDYG